MHMEYAQYGKYSFIRSFSFTRADECRVTDVAVGRMDRYGPDKSRWLGYLLYLIVYS